MADLPAESGSPAPSVEDRIGALADSISGVSSAEDDSPEGLESQAQDDADGGDDAANDDEGEAPQDDGTVEEEIDGVVIRGSKEAVSQLKQEREHKADYTRKTQEVAVMRKAAEDRVQFAEAREQITSQLIGDVTALHTKRAELAQLQAQDLGYIYDSNPSMALRIQSRMSQLGQEVQAMERDIGGKADGLQRAMKAHRDKQWQLAEEGIRQRVPNITQEENLAMARQVESLGFTVDELQSRFADPRILHALYKAAKYDSLQQAKPNAMKAVSKAPPVVKPGSVQPNQFSQKMNFHKAMKTAKSDNQKADLIGSRLINRFNI